MEIKGDNMTDKKQELGFNTRCEKLKRTLANEINTSNLPIAPVYYIVKNLYQELENLYYGALNSEAQEQMVPEVENEEDREDA